MPCVYLPGPAPAVTVANNDINFRVLLLTSYTQKRKLAVFRYFRYHFRGGGLESIGSGDVNGDVERDKGKVGKGKRGSEKCRGEGQTGKSEVKARGRREREGEMEKSEEREKGKGKGGRRGRGKEKWKRKIEGER
jgi:hypothetical protein